MESLFKFSIMHATVNGRNVFRVSDQRETKELKAALDFFFFMRKKERKKERKRRQSLLLVPFVTYLKPPQVLSW